MSPTRRRCGIIDKRSGCLPAYDFHSEKIRVAKEALARTSMDAAAYPGRTVR